MQCELAVWADEGGLQLVVSMLPGGAARFVVEESPGLNVRRLAAVTIASYRVPRIVSVLSPDLSALRARIAELEAEIASVPVVVAYGTTRYYCIEGGSQPWLDAIAARQAEIRARAQREGAGE